MKSPDLLRGKSGNVTRWRVHYHVAVAGGGLWPTWVELNQDFEDEEAAIKAAEAYHRARDSRDRRSYTGYFKEAWAEPAPERTTA